MKNTLLIVGTIAYDDISTPFGSTQKTLGGAAVYSSLAASYFSLNAQIVSVVGNDIDSAYLAALKSKNIDISGIEKIEDMRTFYWKAKYHNDMNTRTTLDTQLNAFQNFNPVLSDNYQNADMLLLGNLDPDIQISVLNQQQNRPKLVMLDTMNFWISQSLNSLQKVLKMVDIVCINDEEARQLSQEHSLLKSAKYIQNLGAKYVIIKKGEHGAMLFFEDQIFIVPGLPLSEVVDPTGAGDSFAGGIMGFLTEKNTVDIESIKLAMVYGSTLASFTVEKFGTENIFSLTKEKIAQRLHFFKNLTQFELEI